MQEREKIAREREVARGVDRKRDLESVDTKSR